MDLFYSELTDGSGPPDLLDPQAFNGFDSGNKVTPLKYSYMFPGGSDSYLTMPGSGLPFLPSSETFHTPSLGDEEFEIPPISLDPDSSLTVSDVVSHFGGPGGGGHPSSSSSSSSDVVPGGGRGVVVGGDDPSFASTFVSHHPGGGVGGVGHHLMGQTGGSMLESGLGMDLGHPLGSQFSSSSPMTIDVPLGDMGHHGLLGSNQLTTIDQSELSAQLGLGLGGGAMASPEQHPLSAAGSPTSSLQDDDMEDFRRSVLVESPVSLAISLDPSLSDSSSPAPPTPPFASGPAPGRKGGGGGRGGKPGRKPKKDPNEPVKPVSAYALFFRDTQAAIKGQNPHATFGEVSKIVASMWDSLGEEQKQVYKRKNEAAKREYLKNLAAYRTNQLSQAPPIEVLDSAPSPPPPAPPPPRASRPQQYNPEENTITNICTSNIILDLPQGRATRSRTGATKPAPPPAPPSPPSPPPTVTKIIIKRAESPSGVDRVVVTSSTSSSRQPPPLQNAALPPPMPRLGGPPPLQAKPLRVGGGGGGAPGAPPPLQIKFVVKKEDAASIIAPPLTSVTSVTSSPSGLAERQAEEEEGMEVEVSVAHAGRGPGGAAPAPATPSLCVRAGCNNAAVESKDWDNEYCSNECVATHCRDVFMAWCAIRGGQSTTVS